MPLTSPPILGTVPVRQPRVLIITYRTDPRLRAVVPEPPNFGQRERQCNDHPHAGRRRFGDYTEASGDPVFSAAVRAATQCMFFNDVGRSPVAASGLSEEIMVPIANGDRHAGRSHCGPIRDRHDGLQTQRRSFNLSQVRTLLRRTSSFKIIPHVDGRPRICELVEYRLEDVAIRGAWTGPAALHLSPHALAPVAELPVLEIVSAIHILADLTLGLGKVVHDYLQQPIRRPLRNYERSLVT
jgi:acetoacetate decarboxylase